jgi:hypothetical protein
MLAIIRCRIFLSSSLLSKNFKIEIYRIIILSVVLYGCENWSPKLREKCRLRVVENRALRREFGPKRTEVRGELRKLQNEELNDLYSLPNIVRVVKSSTMRCAEHVARMGEESGVHRVLVEKPEGKGPWGRPSRSWGAKLKVGFQDVGGGCGSGWSWLSIGTGGGHF